MTVKTLVPKRVGKVLADGIFLTIAVVVSIAMVEGVTVPIPLVLSSASLILGIALQSIGCA